MPIAFLSTLAFIALSAHLSRAYSLSRLAVSGPLLVLAAVLFAVARALHFRYLRRSAEALSRPSPAPGGDGRPVGVSHWVQALANVAFGMALAAGVRLVEELVP